MGFRLDPPRPKRRTKMDVGTKGRPYKKRVHSKKKTWEFKTPYYVFNSPQTGREVLLPYKKTNNRCALGRPGKRTGQGEGSSLYTRTSAGRGSRKESLFKKKGGKRSKVNEKKGDGEITAPEHYSRKGSSAQQFAQREGHITVGAEGGGRKPDLSTKRAYVSH